MTTFEDRFGGLFASAYRVSFVIVGDRAEAEDIAQEALARALVRWKRLAGHEEAWVVRVASNLALDRVRATARRARHRPQVREVPGPGGDRVDLQRGLGKLSKRQREVVVLRFLVGCTEAEVADALGCSVGSIKQHSSRGMAVLREVMKEEIGDVPAAR